MHATSGVGECVDMLERGVGHDAVMQRMRQRYTTGLCLRSKCSLVRRSYRGALDDAGARAAARMREACTTAADRARAERFIRSYGRDRWSNAGGELDAIVQAEGHRLLPENVRMVRITREEARECDAIKRRHLVDKHEHARVIDGDAWLTEARRAVGALTGGIFETTAALLVLTGRRTCEILNGRSLFTARTPHSLWFEGQLKREPGRAYAIPVLADSAAILRAIERVRHMQPASIAAATNAAVSARYQSGLGRYMASHPAYGTSKAHTCRSVYVALVRALFECEGWTLQAIAHRVCGHADLCDALHYTALDVRVSPAPSHKACLGRLEDIVRLRRATECSSP